MKPISCPLFGVHKLLFLVGLFGIPKEVIPVGLIAIGHPGEKKRMVRRSYKSRMHPERWEE